MICAKPSNLILSLLATVSIVGCGGVSGPPVTSTASTLTGSSLRGQVKGGQQPISGATIQLYQVGTAGDGFGAAALGSSAMTNPSGGFTITGDYTCPGSNPQVYLLATGGNPGLASGTNNTAISLIAALGSCSSLSSSTVINLNEVTTVAAVAALLPYMTAPTSIGSGTSDATALMAAFTLASQFASTATGSSPGTAIPAGDAVPSTLINSLADIISACVNSAGGIAGDGSSCGTLFTNSTPSGGAAPTDVATALLNILNNPTGNLTSLFALLPSTPPFESTLNAAPSSWEISLFTTPAGGALADFGTPEQIIRGFGASEVFDSVLPSSQITGLYGQSAGQVGLSIMRVQIAPATWTSSTQTADTTQWTTELTNAQAAQQGYGALIFATPWTPPASMKTSSTSQPYNSSCSSGTDLCGGYLNPTSYSDYANYLEAFVNYAAGGQFGTNAPVNLYAVSVQNEPDANVSYVSCFWTGAQFDAWIAGYGSVLTTGANPVKLMMPESESFNTNESDPALNDINAVDNISIIGGHLYGAAPFYYTNAENKGKDVWMTEHLLVPANNSSPVMADALTMAEEIHNSMTVGDYNAYVYWQGPSYPSNKTPQEHLIDQNANPTYYGFAMEQFSYFVRPGYVRASATATPVSGVYVSAYTGQDQSGNQHYVIVAVNSSTTAENMNFTLSDAPTTISSMTPYETTSVGGFVPQSAVAVTGGQLYYTMPAQSIVTFVQ